MKKRNVSAIILAIAISICLVGVIFTGCSSNKNVGDKGGASGSILTIGSTALQPLIEEAAKNFMDKNQDAIIQVQGGGSGNGLTSVSNGSAQIGNSDIEAQDKAGIDAASLEDHKVCVIGFAPIVGKNIKVDNLTKQQLIDIFTGKIDNWSKVGGDDMKIVLITRPASSGTRATFKKYALDGLDEASGKALSQDSSGAVLKAVAETEGAISYIGLSYINKNKDIKALNLDGIAPNAENIKSGKYRVWSYEHMYTKGSAKGLEKAFIEYVMSDEIKPIVEKLGYIPIKDMEIER